MRKIISLFIRKHLKLNKTKFFLKFTENIAENRAH